MKTFAVLVSGFILFVLAAFGAQAATPDVKRVALVIGNSKYVNAVPLPNPANDATAKITAHRCFSETSIIQFNTGLSFHFRFQISDFRLQI